MNMIMTKRVCSEQGCMTPLSRYNTAKKCFVHDKGVPRLRGRVIKTEPIAAPTPSTSHSNGASTPSKAPESARHRGRQRVPDDVLTTARVEEMTGATLRQLNHWVKKGYIDGQGPLKTGMLRVWTWMQVNRVQELVWFKEDVLAQGERLGVDPNFTSSGMEHPNAIPRVGPRE